MSTARSQLTDRIGSEIPLGEVSQLLQQHVLELEPAAVGAYQICCSDESEQENIAAFDQHVSILLPELKAHQRQVFRTVNLGGRYEVGAVGIAEDHFASPQASDSFKVVLIKVSSHTAVTDTGETIRYGTMTRYQCESTACGALYAMLGGAKLPATLELAEHFGGETLAALRDDGVDAATIGLRMAITNSVLQTRRLCDDIAEHVPSGPTVYVIASCVSINREGPDTEVLTGLTQVDTRVSRTDCVGSSLGAEPLVYQLTFDGDRVAVKL